MLLTNLKLLNNYCFFNLINIRGILRYKMDLKEKKYTIKINFETPNWIQDDDFNHKGKYFRGK
jgi:hypothetical protein